MTNEEIGTWFGGVATLLAVFVALFLQEWTRFRNRPRLCIEHRRDSKSDIKYLPPSLADELGGPERHEMWLRVRVTNQGFGKATDVELRFIRSCVEESGAKNNRPSWAFKASNLNATAVNIHANFTQIFDLAYLAYEAGGPTTGYLALTETDLSEWAAWKRQIESGGEDTELTLGWTYLLYFALVCDNYSATYYRMRVRFNKPQGDQQASPVGEDDLRPCVASALEGPVSLSEAFGEAHPA